VRLYFVHVRVQITNMYHVLPLCVCLLLEA